MLMAGCNSETPGEYHGRLIDAACDCRNTDTTIRIKAPMLDGNAINELAQQTRDSLLQLESGFMDALHNCLHAKKLSDKDIDNFWNDYDIKKMIPCDPAFHNYYSYIYNLKHGSY
jgi:hypothetical protein